jgi:hypothetical protein
MFADAGCADRIGVEKFGQGQQFQIQSLSISDRD